MKISTDFVDWNVEKGQQGKTLLSSKIFRRVYCSFLNEKCLKLTLKMTKNPKVFNFQSLYAFLLKFR